MLSEDTLIIRGPASFTPLSGDATILGTPIQPNAIEAIEPQKQLPLETENAAELEIALEEGAESFVAQGSTIPESWNEAATALGWIREGKVTILGATDVGKRTPCAHI